MNNLIVYMNPPMHKCYSIQSSRAYVIYFAFTTPKSIAAKETEIHCGLGLHLTKPSTL